MFIFATAAIVNEQKIDKNLIKSKKWIEENIVKKKIYERTIVIDNNFLARNSINLKNHEKENITINKWSSMGYQIWKPLSILKILEELENGDILYYHDANIYKYPSYINNVAKISKKIKKYISCNKNKSIFIFHEGYKPVSRDIKYQSLLENKFQSRKYKNGIWAGSLILRKNEISLKFIEDWCFKSQTSLLIPNEYPYLSKIFYPRYDQHAPEQATLFFAVQKFLLLSNEIKLLRTYKRNINFDPKFQYVMKLRDFYKFLIWFSKDLFYFIFYLIAGENKFYRKL